MWKTIFIGTRLFKVKPKTKSQVIKPKVDNITHVRRYLKEFLSLTIGIRFMLIT